MSLIQLYVASEISRDVVSVLGELGTVQFRDLNEGISSFQRSFVKEVRQLDMLERQLRTLEDIIESHPEVHVTRTHVTALIQSNMYNKAPVAAEMEDLMQSIAGIEARVVNLQRARDGLAQHRADLVQNRYAISICDAFFRGPSANPIRVSIERSGLLDLEFDIETQEVNVLGFDQALDARTQETPLTTYEPQLRLNFITGIIDRAKLPLLTKILWRTLRGNLVMDSQPVDALLPDKNGVPTAKDVFMVFVQGEMFKAKVRKIIESLEGVIYHVDQSQPERVAALEGLNARLMEVEHVLDGTEVHLGAELAYVAEHIELWAITAKMEKSLFVVLNKCDYDPTRRCLIAEGWIPRDQLGGVKSALRDVTERSGTNITSVVNELQTNRTPPTFHRTNKFTAAFQSIIDAYGIATYQEVNPGLATIVTFPFMFAIMFGDLGHGFIVFLMALYLILNEKSLAVFDGGEIFDMAFSGRYIVLLMGAFSMYTGLLYNDIFSKSMTLFRSGWVWPEKFAAGDTILASFKGTYWFGLDYAWHGSENNLLFSNSYKMKLSILMGFVHMSYSLYFSLVNYRRRKSRVDIIGNFIPSVLFMQSIFGYLALTIVYKWTVDWPAVNKQPPGLLNMLIGMFLSPGSVNEQLYRGQAVVQVGLVAIAFLCVPWLLLYKPMTIRNEMNKAISQGYASIEDRLHQDSFIISDTESTEDFVIQDVVEPHDTHSFGDIIIHQVIHTIEFCLNCVSHTASYLRLWALSLAHAQLSSVLWTMTIQNAFGATGKKGIAMVFFLFALWFVLTVCILVLMEGTSAMLHSLRLHWVEAMSKFFEGEGYAYEPFAFKTVLTEKEM
ncbi:hypothetical protein BABINDRAFT_159877 [Babjeviella inositovora NRRL Y-12698]|uniref:V-type proton ATPase subunit a n=1 Tax=Babjeviella inositovora NRRL Y-12698 TaxID=984486 RepID=A0A1E3QVB7_9ASCO|nr:uncharacterized protein BABINDRAFT_159877 [Babjeviella inositovora NRRL Y-12698]ODQ81605.1 hypothetical protein BABINDRAFT_159877 [Babjeviella inositovora NRRL Y-12698]